MVDLRTRLAKTLHRLYGPSLGAHPWGWDCEPKGTQGMFLDDADAVIRELRIEKEFGCGTSDPRHGCRCSHRYATEWETDD